MKLFVALALLSSASGLAMASGPGSGTELGKLDVQAIFHGKSMFIQNDGQLDDPVRFSTSVGQAHLFFHPNGLKYQITSTEEIYVNGEEVFVPSAETWSVDFLGSNKGARLEGEQQTDFYLNVYGNGLELDSIPSFESIWYRDIYPSTDLHYYYKENQLEYDFVLRKGARLERLKMKFDGVKGVRVTADGKLLVKSPAGKYYESAPVAWQIGPEGNIPVEIRFKELPGNVVSFIAPKEFNPALPLVIDPITLDWFTFLGGNSGALEGGYNFDIAVDGSNNLYATGWYKKSEISSRTPTLLGTTGASGLRETYVCKLNSAGTISYLTLIQGNNQNFGLGIFAESATGNTHIVGATRATNLPTTQSFQGSHAGGTYDGFYMRLNSTGSRLCLSYLGGAGEDNPIYLSFGSFTSRTDVRKDFSLGSLKTGITFDGTSAYLCGWTTSGGLPGVVNTRTGTTDGFVAKITPGTPYTCSSRFLGGTGGDTWAYDVVVSGTNLYVGGTTNATSFYNGSTTPGNDLSGFITRLTTTNLSTAPSATRLLGVHASATAGTSEDCYVECLAVDASGNVYCSGVTERRLLLPAATAGQYFFATSSSYVNFFYKMPANLSTLDLRYIIPNYGTDDGSDLWVSSDGSYIFGVNSGDTYNLTASSAGDYTKAYSSGADLYWVMINTSTHSLRYGQFMGGNSSDYAGVITARQVSGDFIVWLGFTTHSTASTPTSIRARPTSGVDEPAFAKFTITGEVLPIRLVDFEGHANGDGNLISWLASGEESNSSYILERGIEQDEMQEIYRTAPYSPGGQHVSYEFFDERPLSKISYYRLKMIEADGSFTYSNVVQVINESVGSAIADIHPVPQTAGLPVEILLTEGMVGGKASILDASGKRVFHCGIENQSLKLETVDFKPGVYILQVTNKGTTESRKFILR